jgi:Ca2+-binding RTX toxin-like protein
MAVLPASVARTRSLLALAAAGSSVLIAAFAVGEGQAAPACFGRAATIVGGDNVEGTSGDDVIVVESEAFVDARDGADLICAYGDDYHVLWGGSGADRIQGGAGQESIRPGPGDDLAIGGLGPNFFSDPGRRGDDEFVGGPQTDVLGLRRQHAQPVWVDLARGIARGHGHDRVSGFEVVIGTSGSDTLLGDGGHQRLDGVRGHDRIDGRDGDDVIMGASADSFEGPAGSDPWLRGGSGDDRIKGGAGFDRLYGGPGQDLLVGGSPGERPGDSGDGGPGRDTCRELERSRRCER